MAVLVKMRRFLMVQFSMICMTTMESMAQSTLQNCTIPLGMESGTITDSKITASSTLGANRPHFARLHGNYAWLPVVYSNLWIQVDFERTMWVTGLATQGHPSRSYWVTSYYVQHGTDGMNWQTVQTDQSQNFTANVDKNTEVRNTFTNPINLRYIRIYPSGFNDFVALRFELYGCEATWSSWTSWTTCSRTCGSGQQRRTRTCSIPDACYEDPSERRFCNTQGCPAWSSWTSWTTCSRTCGSGRQSRTRTCSIPGTCDEDSSETRVCNTRGCPALSSWTSWMTCSKTCGSGRQSRTRTCSIPGACYEDPSDTRDCNTQGCPLEICKDPLGMESGAIRDDQITASSTFSTFYAYYGRLHGNSVWIPTSSPDEWIQVDFERTLWVTGVATQGHNRIAHWVTAYSVQHGTDGSNWQTIQDEQNMNQIFTGNLDNNTEVRNRFTNPISLRYIRIYPTEHEGFVALRFELYGCEASDLPTISPPTAGIITNQLAPVSTNRRTLSTPQYSTPLSKTTVFELITSSPGIRIEIVTSEALSSQEFEGERSQTGLIVGVAIGSFLIFLIGLVAFIWCIKRKKSSNVSTNQPMSQSTNGLTLGGQSDAAIGDRGKSETSNTTHVNDAFQPIDTSITNTGIHHHYHEIGGGIDLQGHLYTTVEPDTNATLLNEVTLGQHQQPGQVNAYNGHDEEGSVDNDIYSSTGQEAEGWVENDIYSST